MDSVKGVDIMNITDEAKNDLQSILDDNNAKGIRLYFAGLG